jgi:hypothetical protein
MNYWFPDDENKQLYSVQLSVQSSMISYLFECPAKIYREYAQFLEVETELLKKIYQKNNEPYYHNYNNRWLYSIYGLLAAYYRFTKNPSGQLPLFSGDRTIEDIYREDWGYFYYPEVRKISEDEVCGVNLIRAVVYNAEDFGMNASKIVLERLKQKYPMTRKREVLPEFLMAEKLDEEEKKRFNQPTWWSNEQDKANKQFRDRSSF